MAKINPLIAYAFDNNIVVLNNENICISSSDEKNIGRLFELDISQKKYKSEPLNESPKPAIFVYDNKEYSSKEIPLLKNMAKVILESYVKSIAKPLGTIDHFIMEVVEQPFNTGKLAGFEKNAVSFNLDLELQRIAILVQMRNFTENALTQEEDPEDVIKSWKQKITNLITGFFTIKSDIIAGYTGNGNFIFYKETNGDVEKFIKLIKSAYNSIFGPLTFKDEIQVGVSNIHNGILGLHEAYHEANQAIQLGSKFSKSTEKLFWYGDLGTLRILTVDSPEKKVSYAKEILQPLEKETLKQTLEIYFNENMDIKRTAQKMKIHPNTVNYRLTKIAEKLNLDPKVFKQAFELRIALLTDKIFN